MDLRPYSKAIAGTLSSMIVAFLMKHNIIIADNLPDALEVIISGVIVMLSVYLAPKNTQKYEG